MKVNGKWVLITGANRGIGKACALQFARKGAKIALVLRKADSNLSQQLKNAGASEVATYPCDLSERSDIDSLVKALENQRVDILFNNAGLLTGGLFENQNLDEILKMFQVNINAVIHLTHALLPKMLQQKSGKIIIHGSVSSYMRFPCATTYAASKAAVVAFAECLQAELKGTGVSTLSLITPAIKTEMFDKIDELYGPHVDTPKNSISPEEYAVKIVNAVENDSEYLNPVGAEAAALWLSKHIPSAFRYAVQKNFKR